jgi:deazaflavin-dependent oxidoreductase (nitroreductase family)
MARQYIKPPWMQRHVGNRLAPLFRSSLISKLSVPGRRSGRWHTVPVAVLNHDGERYLVSYRGESDWARNLRAAKNGRLIEHGQVAEISVVEVPVSERAPLIDAYLANFAKMPTVAATFRALPNPAEHPTFRIITPSQSPPAT